MTIYNPHLLQRQELIETFVARQRLLDELLDDLRRGGRQHHLLVGNRGSGKTTLLLRLAAAIEDDTRLTKKCIPLRFPEEQYNVSRPSDFWMNAIDALADALELHGDRSGAQQLESSLAALEPLDEKTRSTRSLALLEDWAKKSKRLIVLLVDNLDLVLDRLASSLWELREALSIDNRLVVIGASSTFLGETTDYQSPFYDFLHVHELGPLSVEEAHEVLLSLSRRSNTPGVAEVLEHDPGRFHALHALTGGVPRTLALLHRVLATGHRDGVERDLEGLLDQVTPYYKARFDDLPAQSQVIVDKVALHWHPITAAGCQAATQLDLNTVSAQLNRLVKNGVLAKVELPAPSKLGFQLSERFFNIWYLMRASRRLRRRLSWFVEFLRIFYGEEDLRRRAEDLVRAAPPETLSDPAKLLAFASAVPDDALRRRLEFRAVGLLAEKGIAAIREVMDLEGEDVHLASVVDRVRALREVRARIAKVKITWPLELSSSAVADAIAGHPIISLALKREIASACKDGYSKIAAFLDTSDYYTKYGKRLLEAIANGEFPSVLDITLNDIRPFIEQAERAYDVALDIVFYNEQYKRPLTTEMLHELSQFPDGRHGIAGVAYSLISEGKWTRSRQFLRILLESCFPTSELWMMLLVLSGYVTNGRVREAIELVIESGVAERWVPVYEALRAIEAGNKSALDALAPEVRAPALSLFNVLTAANKSADQQGNDASTAAHSSAKKTEIRRPAKRRGGGRPRSLR